jgi:hypothetical protein
MSKEGSKDPFQDFDDDEWRFAFELADKAEMGMAESEALRISDGNNEQLKKNKKGNPKKDDFKALVEEDNQVIFFAQFGRIYNPAFDYVDSKRSPRSVRLKKLQWPVATTISVEEGRLDMLTAINQICNPGICPRIMEKFVEVDKEKGLVMNTFRLKEYMVKHPSSRKNKSEEMIQNTRGSSKRLCVPAGNVDTDVSGQSKIGVVKNASTLVTPEGKTNDIVAKVNATATSITLEDEFKDTVEEETIATMYDETTHGVSSTKTVAVSSVGDDRGGVVESIEESNEKVAAEPVLRKPNGEVWDHRPLGKEVKTMFTKNEKNRFQSVVCGFFPKKDVPEKEK